MFIRFRTGGVGYKVTRESDDSWTLVMSQRQKLLTSLWYGCFLTTACFLMKFHHTSALLFMQWLAPSTSCFSLAISVTNDRNDNIRAHALFSFCAALLKLSYLYSIASWRSISLNKAIYTRSAPWPTKLHGNVSTNYVDGRGGISFLGLGDFRQVTPVVSGAGESPSLAASEKSSLCSYRKKIGFSHSTPLSAASITHAS